MTRLLLMLGRRLVISKRHRSVRLSLIFLLTHFLLLCGAIFTVETILIVLGIQNISIPLTHRVLHFITELFF